MRRVIVPSPRVRISTAAVQPPRHRELTANRGDTPGCGSGTRKLDLNARAGLLRVRSPAPFVRPRFRRAGPDLAGREMLDRLRAGLGARLRRRLPRGARIAPLGSADAALVRSPRARAAPDRALEPGFRRSARAGDPRRDPPRALRPVRGSLRFSRLQLLPGRTGQRRLAWGQDPEGDRGTRG